MYLPKLFVLAAACSLLAASVLYHAVEKPAARAISGWFTGNPSKGRKGAMNTAVSNSDLLKTN
jgi:peptidoglycan/LPS O-acetylase OafA/YrhL